VLDLTLVSPEGKFGTEGVNRTGATWVHDPQKLGNKNLASMLVPPAASSGSYCRLIDGMVSGRDG
jgi:hypothetical protein